MVEEYTANEEHDWPSENSKRTEVKWRQSTEKEYRVKRVKKMQDFEVTGGRIKKMQEMFNKT